MSSQTTPLTTAEIDARVADAQRITLDIDSVCTLVMKDLVKANANAIGSPLEFILFPLLSISAHFMGPDTRVIVNEHWREPLILWNVVLADKGQKKSPALNRFIKPIQHLEEEMRCVAEENDEADDETGDIKTMPQIYIEHFSMEELHYTLKRNRGRVVGLYDEISLLYEQLDKYKNGNSDRKTLLSLINGSPWRRNFRSSNSVIFNTCFNIAGFVQPDVIVNLLNGNDYDGFCDRQLFVLPPELDVDYDEILPPPPQTPDLMDIFNTLDRNHQSTSNYSLTQEAHEEFVAFHDHLNERKRAQHRRDKDRKSILSKAKGQVVRLAAVLYALNQAIVHVHNPNAESPWSFQITREFMQKAIALMNFCMEQKFALGKRPFQSTPEVHENSASEIDEHRVKRLLELPSPITVTKISQSHIQQRVHNKYRKEEAEALMEDVVKIDLGQIVVEQFQAGKSTRGKKTLVKRKLEDLEDNHKEVLKKMKVDMGKYQQ